MAKQRAVYCPFVTRISYFAKCLIGLKWISAIIRKHIHTVVIIITVITRNVNIANTVYYVKLGRPHLVSIFLTFRSPHKPCNTRLKILNFLSLHYVKTAFMSINPIILSVVLCQSRISALCSL